MVEHFLDAVYVPTYIFRINNIFNLIFIQKQDRAKYDPQVAGWINVYTVLHFLLVFFAFNDLSRYNLVSYYTIDQI